MRLKQPQASQTNPFDASFQPTSPSDPFDMDTLTLSLTDDSYQSRSSRIHQAQNDYQNQNAIVYTSSFTPESPQPAAAEWYTRLISPLTGRQSKHPYAMSTPIMGKQYQGQFPNTAPQVPTTPGTGTEHENHGFSTVLLIFIPVMVVILTVLIGLVIFLVAVLYMRRRKGIQ